MRHFENIKFSEAYDFASFTWALIVEPEQFSASGNPIERVLLLCNDDELESRLLRPNRDTLLHLVLRELYCSAYINDFEHHRSDMLDLVVEEYETVLRFNEVLFKQKELPPEQAANFEKVALRRVAYLRKKLPVNRIAQATFQLLFRDRRFLLAFNRAVASALLAEVPRIKRVRLPNWLKRGVFYRDNGRCIVCGKDLTGANFLGTAVHFDHILPLSLFGSNDPTNFQLLCADCNLRKAVKPETTDKYPVFWPSEGR